ncbi:hypothetical protein GCM10023091_42010 [Ravibacter arvi]|uniref:Outer membrane protein beta-barrel domain-containing protein n=1 Tax=Ravibacter arvi TaxID=2051041 RepID=A0ABP8ME15_9BACT
MKSSCIILSVAGLLGLQLAQPAAAQHTLKDSVIISFNEQTKMVIYGTDRKEIEKLSQYDFNRLIKDVLSKLDSVTPSNGVSKDWVDGQHYLKEEAKKPKAEEQRQEDKRPSGKGQVAPDDDAGFDEGETIIRVTKTFRTSDGYQEVTTDTVVVSPQIRRIRRSPRQGIDFKIGLNTYGDRSPEGYRPEEFDLRPGASRYISLGGVKSIPLVRGRRSGFFMDLGLDISWYNLMFQGNEVIRKEDQRVAFPTLPDGNGVLALKKSKLVAPHVNLSVMPTLTFAGSVFSHVSAGMYAGYRLGGYHTSKPVGGAKSKVSGDYYMRDIRYGAAFELGLRAFPDLFVNYDFNSLFEAGRGPQVRMLSFGLRI